MPNETLRSILEESRRVRQETRKTRIRMRRARAQLRLLKEQALANHAAFRRLPRKKRSAVPAGDKDN